ncbi:PREDICTED: uncharacterized protein LOC109227751 [Nicotiana attenuata]|uniref:uncharacterized protein LOC109227751 n=1 Tax=Nicotiana attenuata TaxID=49451 RepID=UPI000905A000|nr:PREDICTED: uncharacterized protein LOC109227751 [Nicotiana attenuata]
MDALIWNIRSVNTQQAFERQIKMHRKHHYEFIGLMEPKQHARKLERYRTKISFAQAIPNVSNKIWAFIDEVFEVTVMWRFNVIWDEEEKFGGLTVSLNEIGDFRHCINTCNLTDLGFKGSIFTWWNGRAEEDRIEVPHLSKIGSDYSPMQLKCDIEAAPVKKPFRFLNFWVKRESFKNMIASMEEVVMVHEAEFEDNPTKMNRERLQRVQAELIKFLALEEKNWKQKAWMTWFKDGDRNTKFFHAQVKGRRKRLQLNRIQNSLGNWIEEDEEIVEEAVKFYEDQNRETTVPTSFDIINHVPTLINVEQNSDLVKQPTKDEVKNAVFGLNIDSVGGPDGYTDSFINLAGT